MAAMGEVMVEAKVVGEEIELMKSKFVGRGHQYILLLAYNVY